MDTAAKAARQKVKAQQTSKPDQTVAKQDKEAGTAIATEMMPSLFGPQPPSAEPTQATNAEERKNRP